MEYTIYFIENEVNHKGYVGLTCRDVEARRWEHVNEAKNGHDRTIHQAINKYGPDNFTIIPLTWASDYEEAEQLEIEWIERLRTYEYGYNETPGGNGAGLRGEDSLNAKISDERAYVILEDHLLSGRKAKETAQKHQNAAPETINDWRAGRTRPDLRRRFDEEHPDYDGWTEFHQGLYDAVVEFMTTRTTLEDTAEKHGLNRSQLQAVRQGRSWPRVLERFHEEHPEWDGVVRDYHTNYSPLTEADVAEIRERYVRENITQAALGEEYGVSQYCVSDIINFKSWDHVQSEVDEQLRSDEGSGHPTRKLAQGDGEEIRRRYEEEDITQAALGDEYGVDPSHISDIVNHKRLA